MIAEIPAFLLRAVLGSVPRRVPLVRPMIRAFMNGLFRVVLLPFGRNRRPGRPVESTELVARTDELNLAAEEYFAVTEDREFMLAKPFSDSQNFPRLLFHLGVLLEGIRLRPTDVVVELGAGACWVSHFLNKYGCKTISIDVSKTALELGEEVFRRDPATRWGAAPEFIAYDGHRLPLEDASVDKIVINDAFHHIPNQREILTELHRVLRPDGIVGMSEPGKGHAATEASQQEVEKYGVLENELVVEDLGALARDCGFQEAIIIVASQAASWEIPTDDLGPFMRGKGFTRYWDNQGAALLASHVVLLYNGDPRPTTRQPKALGAHFMIPRSARRLRVRQGESARLKLRIRNTAETRWLAAESDAGWTRLGGHLYRAGEPPELVDFDWLRNQLPRDVGQFDIITVPVQLPPIEEPGTYEIVFDMLVERLTWFGDRGSETARIRFEVESRSGVDAG